jgi:hypothetical protein
MFFKICPTAEKRTIKYKRRGGERSRERERVKLRNREREKTEV